MATGQRKGRFIILGIILLVIVSFAGLLLFLSNLYKTETYYVLNQDVPTRTQVTPEMLSPVVTSEGTAPANALTIADIQDGGVFTQYPLSEGDVLTPSNVGGFEDISVGVPDEWVVTNFSVDADNAVLGRIRRGTYFDLMVLNENNEAFYPFVNILALDTTVSLSNASSAEAVDSSEAHSGQTSQYTVGMSPQDAARLHAILAEYSNVRLMLSPRQNEYAEPRLSDYAGLFSWNGDVKDEGNYAPKNEGEDTDYTFSHVERDEFGKPVDKAPETCGQGNAKITGDACKTSLSQSSTDSAQSKGTR